MRIVPSYLAAVTVLDVIQRSSEFLTRKGVESPRLQVELMLANVLQLPRLELYLNFDRAVTEVELGRVRELVKRRGEREPLQHVLGSTCFCGLDFAVNSSVLIPRPETEVLAEKAWQQLQQLTKTGTSNSPLVLDLGTGSGCLGVILAVKCPEAKVHAIDISEGALEVARANATRLGVLDRVTFYKSDLCAALPKSLTFELVVCNPPYIPSVQIETLQPEVRDYDPRLALDGGVDGLEYYRRLAGEAPPYMAQESRLMAEFGDDQEKDVSAIFRAAGWRIDELVTDLAGKLRIIVARRPIC
jgi:release factor glutamine methyltransferase